MKRYALFGAPVAQSLSPLMHNTAFLHTGIEARYDALEVSDAGEAIRIMEKRDIRGAGVTIPLKVSMAAAMDEVSDGARRIGAVNTIVRRGNRLRGENTDWVGIDRTVRELMGDPRDAVFLVLGAGGTARAALYAVLRGGGEAIVVSRRDEASRDLAAEFSCMSRTMDSLNDIRADCFINTTPLGMRYGEEDATPLARELLGRFRWGLDAVYRPLVTRLVGEAREEGCRAVGGLDMFVHQGAEQFLLWTGEEPPLDLMRRAVRNRLEDETNQ
ncbi:MAG: shikimate dehydrogenase [Syntrophales bacterium]|jgi:shikimate dehydrogenase|nr:shikimate dehydrogenase [Syntrophales bacterium]MCK9527386.1 shikimate dehydrogenase [Syntrophales bacterium]MDX9921488.1 shikimate dehydrogenase [Syntrophales bacterium]